MSTLLDWRRCAATMSLALVFASSACNGSDSIIGPDPPGSPSPRPPAAAVTVSGVVFEHTTTGVRPLAGLPLRVQGTSEAGPPVTDVTSDANGRYEVSGLLSSRFVFVGVRPEAAYRAPCPPSTYTPSSDHPLDVHVAANALLSATGAPRSMPITAYLTVSGFIYETTSNGRRPLAGALVDLFTGDSLRQPIRFDDQPDADTFSNSDGYFQMCAIRDDFALELRARLNGYRTARQRIWESWTVDLEMARD